MRVRVAVFALVCLVFVSGDRLTPVVAVNHPGQLLDGAGRFLVVVVRTIIQHDSLANLLMMLMACLMLVVIRRTNNPPE